MKQLSAYLILLSLASFPALGENGTQITGTNPWENPDLTGGDTNPLVDTGGTVDYNAISVNSLEAGKLQGALNTNGVAFDLGNYGNGREYKYDQAEKTAEMGKGAAIATGTALMAAGIPMTASIIASVRAAGYALIAKAALEFAQAAADNSAANQNADREAYTRRADNDIGQGSRGTGISNSQLADTIASQINTPELQRVLTNNGVNSDAFVRDIASGNLRDLQSVAAAMGDTTSFTPEQIAAAMASNPQLNGEKGVANLGVDEDQQFNTLGEEGEGKPRLELSDPTVAENQGGKALAQTSGDLAIGPGAGNTVGAGRGNGAPGEGGVGAAGADGALAGLFGADGKLGAITDVLSRLTREQLAALGILKAKPGENIFQKAHRCYRSYSRWRARDGRLAANR